MRAHDFAHALLLVDQAFGRVHAHQAKFADDALVFGADQPLEQLERFIGIAAKPEVKAGFVVLQLRPADRDTLHRLVERHVEVERQRRWHGERVQAAQPRAIDPAHGITDVGGVDVAIGQDDGAGLQRGHDLAVRPTGKVGGMDQAERHRRKQLHALATPRGALDDRRRVPLAEDHQVALVDQPFAQQVELGAFARAVDAFDDDEPPG